MEAYCINEMKLYLLKAIADPTPANTKSRVAINSAK